MTNKGRSKASVGPIRHAPWSRRFKTFYVNGWHSHELQVGPIVVYVRHSDHKVTIKRDAYWL